MREERESYLENHPTQANGYYTHDLLTLVGPLENLAGAFRSHPHPLCCWCEHLEDLCLFGGDLRSFLLAPEYLLAQRGHPRTGESLAGKAPERGVLRGVLWMGPEEKRPRNRCTLLLESSPMDEGRSSGFGSWARKGKMPGIGRRFSRISSTAR